MKYQKPNLINSHYLNQITQNIYVYATFMKSGKQFYCVETQQPKNKLFVHSFISKFRNEEIMAYKKSFKHAIIIKRFRREISVFK